MLIDNNSPKATVKYVIKKGAFIIKLSSNATDQVAIVQITVDMINLIFIDFTFLAK